MKPIALFSPTRAPAAVLAVLALLPAVAWAAPSGSATKTKRKSAALNACKLLTNSEVTVALGEPIASTHGGPSATGARFCDWTGQDTHVLQAGITLIAAHDNAKRRYKNYQALISGLTPVAGVGDEATTDGNIVIARRGDRRFVYLATVRKGEIAASVLEGLAKQALGRLK